MTRQTDQIAQLEAAIAGLEAQRALLGEAVIEAALAPLRQQLAALKGTAAAEPAAPGLIFAGERKPVTIVFADISGFTAMSEKMDPEQVRSLMNNCFDDLVPAIHKYGGTVDKFIGDEIMALFGAPAAHENDPERALRAALEMLTRLEDFNARHQTSLSLHFGINTGLVIAGGIGSQDQQQYSVMGDAVNLASRLEDASERGEIFVGPDTHRLAAALFEFQALTPIRLKGKAELVPVYKLVGVKAQPGRTRGLVGLESPMVGRALELQKLAEVSAAVSQGLGRAVVVVGEPGLGKSRLAAEWKAAAPGLRWAEGRCVSYGQGLAYHLLADVLQNMAGLPYGVDEQALREGLLRLVSQELGAGVMEVYPYLAHMLALRLEGGC
jgi:class 3 adenylate cyclase